LQLTCLGRLYVVGKTMAVLQRVKITQKKKTDSPRVSRENDSEMLYCDISEKALKTRLCNGPWYMISY